jgi:hypothetical protein
MMTGFLWCVVLVLAACTAGALLRSSRLEEELEAMRDRLDRLEAEQGLGPVLLPYQAYSHRKNGKGGHYGV